MVTVSVIVLSVLMTTALSAPVKEDEEVTQTLLLSEDFHIQLPSLAVDVTFRNRSAPRSPEVVLMRGMRVVSQRAKLNRHLSHLVIEAVGEGDEGVYTVTNQEKAGDVKHTRLIVRDCTIEQVVKYGDNYRMLLAGINPPITLEFRPIAVEANQTFSPGLVIFSATQESQQSYQGRISSDERHVVLSTVTGADEGSYTILDKDLNIKRKECLNVKEHHNFVILPHGKRLKINLILHSSLVQLYYTPDSEPTAHLLLDKGEFTNAPTDLDLADRLSLEGSVVYLDEIKHSDVGLFEIRDLQGFTVSTIHLKLEPYRLESLYVAIIALLGLLVFLLLVCLLSCLIKVKKRAKRAAALEKIAQNAGKEDEGEAFRQVVKNITKLSEESKHSQADNTEKSQSTEVDIKGLEVSSKEVGVGNLETSDSGVGFNTALPLDTDTDAPDQIPDSEAVSISVTAEPETKSSPPPAAAEPKPSAPPPPAAAEPKPSAPPALDIKPSPAPEAKVSPAPEIKISPNPPAEVKLEAPKPEEVKLSPASSPEPKAGLSPAVSKPPAPSPSPELKPAAPKSQTPTPESKTALIPTPEPSKPTTPEPITNGTPEPAPDSKPSPDQAEIITASTPKAVPPKTPEVELKSSSGAVEANKDGTLAEDPVTKTTTTTT